MCTNDSTLEWIALPATKCLPSDSASDHWPQSEYRWSSNQAHLAPDGPTLDNPWTPENDDTLLHPKSGQSGCRDTAEANTWQRQSCSRSCPSQLLESGTVGSADPKRHSRFAYAARSWWEPQSVRLFYPRHTRKCRPTIDDIRLWKRPAILCNGLHRDGLPTKR